MGAEIRPDHSEKNFDNKKCQNCNNFPARRNENKTRASQTSLVSYGWRGARPRPAKVALVAPSIGTAGPFRRCNNVCVVKLTLCSVRSVVEEGGATTTKIPANGTRVEIVVDLSKILTRDHLVDDFIWVLIWRIKINPSCARRNGIYILKTFDLESIINKTWQFCSFTFHRRLDERFYYYAARPVKF